MGPLKGLFEIFLTLSLSVSDADDESDENDDDGKNSKHFRPRPKLGVKLGSRNLFSENEIFLDAEEFRISSLSRNSTTVDDSVNLIKRRNFRYFVKT